MSLGLLLALINLVVCVVVIILGGDVKLFALIASTNVALLLGGYTLPVRTS